jgi:hypothetical protein
LGDLDGNHPWVKRQLGSLLHKKVNKMFGIESFQPAFCESPSELLARNGKNLRGLLGQQVWSSWILWNRHYNNWWTEWPVILGFEGQNLELCINNDNQLSITWHTIDVTRPLFPNSSGSGVNLFWKENALADLVRVHGQRLKAIQIVEYQRRITILRDAQNRKLTGKTINSDWLLIGMEFQFEESYLSIWNALSGIEMDGKPLSSGEYGEIRKSSI